jgi:PiT family inorganic phosphate transporter
MGIESIVILVLATVFGLYMAWSIGANDVANAMGTSVGSGALTLRRAVLIAAVLEFGGAYLVGGHVTETVRQGIVDIEAIPNTHLLMLGMLAALLASAVWLQAATYFGWPVSTTHSIVGAIIGFGVIVAGIGAIHWVDVGYIASSWVLSPLFSAGVAFGIFIAIRRWIMEAHNPVQAMRRWAPWMIFGVFLVLSLVTTFKGLKNLHLDLGVLEALVVALLIASVAGFIGNEMVGRIRAPEVINPKDEAWLQEARQARAALSGVNRALKQLQAALNHSPRIVVQNLGGALELVESARSDLEELSHYRLTAFHEKNYLFIEKIFKYLQILSACAVAFAHGANDVANAIGPLAAVWEIATTGLLQSSVPVPGYLLALGGIGIVVGLATWGWRVIETLGRKITELTPTRGFSAEFGAACTILMASRLGFPVSTTHCLVGAVLGVGFARGLSSINLGIIRSIVFSWIITIPVSAVLAAGIFSLLAMILV